MSLERFHRAQAGNWVGYATALAEIRRGCKSSHWVWYVFPQLEGLGRSSTAQEFALRDLDEACEYLRDPLLRARYEEIMAAVAEQLASGVSVDDLMGGRTDSLKLVSSITLFRAAASRLTSCDSDPAFVRLAEHCELALQRLAAQGYEPCRFTIERCAESAD